MRRALVLALVSLALPMAAWADGIDLVNKFGTIAISNAGITSKGSQLNQFNGFGGHTLGSVSFSTGALLSGSIQSGGTFSSVGSSFKVVGIGNGGQPKGVIFSGAFVGPITWTLVSQSGQNLTFQLTGALAGQLYNGGELALHAGLVNSPARSNLVLLGGRFAPAETLHPLRGM